MAGVSAQRAGQCPEDRHNACFDGRDALQHVAMSRRPGERHGDSRPGLRPANGADSQLYDTILIRAGSGYDPYRSDACMASALIAED